jgi:hypothetical protein
MQEQELFGVILDKRRKRNDKGVLNFIKICLLSFSNMQHIIKSLLQGWTICRPKEERKSKTMAERER